MYSLNELEIFLTAAELGNFSEAARRLHISQPAVSQAISSLEKHFGLDLFLRHGRSVRLTEVGQALKPMARELLAGARRLDETMISMQGEVVGEINIGCSTASGKYLLPGLIARFRKRFHNVRLNVLVSSRKTVMERLLSGEHAIGVSSKRIEHRELEYQEFFTDDVILIAPVEHPWARYGMVYPDDLLDEPMIMREEVSGTSEVLLQGLMEHDISPDMINVSMVLSNAEAIVIAVEEGLGISFISRLAAARCIAAGRVVEVVVQGMDLRRNIYMARSRRFPATRAQSEFWDFVSSPERQKDLTQIHGLGSPV